MTVEAAGVGSTTAFRCEACGWRDVARADVWCCPRCGSVVDFATPEDDRLLSARLSGDGLGRYTEWLGVKELVSLGEPRTPLLRLGGQVCAEIKNEALLPTGSFKDRGASSLVSWLVGQRVERIVGDSSGNAGAAIAAYSARAGLRFEVHVPAHASVAKVAQISAYGADVVRHDAPRAASTLAAQKVARTDNVIYASQVWHPAFILGVQTLAFELWEQRESVPAAVVLPVGAGTLLLGLARGFDRLRSSALTDRVPRLIGVQATNCMPIAAEFMTDTEPPEAIGSIAEGIQVADPPRMRQVVRAIRNSGGTALAVSDSEIIYQMEMLSREGLLVEPTAAAAFAGLQRARDQGALTSDDDVLVVITGSGLKTVGESRDPPRLSVT